MKVLSLFDGMSCGRIALDYLNIPVTAYFASEVDKYATKVSEDNYPDIFRMGDVTKWREWPIKWSTIDLFIGGSPCQGFSSAGKQGGTKAVLDGETVIISDRDTYLEMKEKGAEFLSQSYLFWEYVLCLDHVKAHNPNVKFLLENVKMSKPNMDMITEALGVEPVFIDSRLVSAQMRQRWYWSNWEVPQPEDKGLLLSDVLEDGYVDRDKSYCLDASYYKGGNPKNYFEKSRRQLVFYSAAMVGRRIDPETGKRADSNKKIKPEQYLEVQAHGKSRCLSTVSKDTLVTTMAPGRYKVSDGIYYRSLTPLECERLQTVPEGYTKCVSNTQRYHMLGNGWTVDVIAHILKHGLLK